MDKLFDVRLSASAYKIKEVSSTTKYFVTTRYNKDVPEDLRSPFPGMDFGPMGPVKKDGLNDARTHVDETGAQKPEKAKRQYDIITVEFHRVETPFVIGIWIFFASIAKIGTPSALLSSYLVPLLLRSRSSLL